MLIQNFSHQIILHFLTGNDIIHYEPELGSEEKEKVKNIKEKMKRKEAR